VLCRGWGSSGSIYPEAVNLGNGFDAVRIRTRIYFIEFHMT
jgi:hypothetical protein